MEDNERSLLQRLVRKGDTDAFSTIMRLHAGMVYGTCQRVLGNPAQAADITQETFFQFLKNAHRITGSLGSWLHQVATRRSIDLIRQNTSRRRREEAYAASAWQETGTWDEIEPLVDEALEELPDDQRELLVQHFLEQLSMREIAVLMRLSQPTVSRRIEAALDQLRQNLRARGVIVGSVTLALLLAHTARAAPPAPVVQSLGKIALAQAASAGMGASASISAFAGSAGAKIALAGTALALVTGAGLWGVYRAPPVQLPFQKDVDVLAVYRAESSPEEASSEPGTTMDAILNSEAAPDKPQPALQTISAASSIPANPDSALKTGDPASGGVYLWQSGFLNLWDAYPGPGTRGRVRSMQSGFYAGMSLGVGSGAALDPQAGPGLATAMASRKSGGDLDRSLAFSNMFFWKTQTVYSFGLPRAPRSGRP
jgi:RNA polymerase sigma factor (sigma-70 family)